MLMKYLLLLLMLIYCLKLSINLTHRVKEIDQNFPANSNNEVEQRTRVRQLVKAYFRHILDICFNVVFFFFIWKEAPFMVLVYTIVIIIFSTGYVLNLCFRGGSTNAWLLVVTCFLMSLLSINLTTKMRKTESEEEERMRLIVNDVY